ncbi:MAG: condensation domain-containing protein [Bacteroidota bacterium]
MLSKENIQDIYPLSPTQAGMFFYAHFAPDSNAYFAQMSYRVRLTLDVTAAQKALQTLVDHYDILRTVFIQKSAHETLQVVLKKREIELQYEDLSTHSAPEEYIEAYKKQDVHTPFQLGKDVLMRLAIFQLKEREYEFVWSNHHILMDGWCRELLIKSFYSLYHQYVQGSKPQLPTAAPYKEYIQWLKQQDKEEAMAHWGEYLSGFSMTTEVPPNLTEYGKPYLQEIHPGQLSSQLTQQIKEAAALHRITTNTLLLSAWALLLAQLNDVDDVAFGQVVSGRPPEVRGIQDMVGLFLNTVPVRVRLNPDATLQDHIAQIRLANIASKPYEYTALADIQTLTPVKENLVNHLLTFENYPELSDAEGTLEVLAMDSFEQPHYPFNLVLNPGKENWGLRVSYNGHLYSASYIQDIIRQFSVMVEALCSQPKTTVGELFGQVKAQPVQAHQLQTPEYGSLPAELQLPQAGTWEVISTAMHPVPIGGLGQLGMTLPAGNSIPDWAKGFASSTSGDTHTVHLPYRAQRTSQNEIRLLGTHPAQAYLKGCPVDTNWLQNAVALHPQVEKAAVIAIEATGEHPIWVVYEGSASTRDLQEHLRPWFAEHQIPAHWRRVDQIPASEAEIHLLLHPSQEIQDWSGHRETVKAYWQKLFPGQELSPEDNFFAIGGTSLNIMQLFGLLKEDYPDLVKVAELFDAPTISAQADLLAERLGADAATDDAFEVLNF